MRDDLLDTDLSPTPTEPLRGVRAARVLAVPVLAAVMASGCTTEVVGVTDAGIADAGIYVADAGRSDAPPVVSDAGLTVFDAGVADAADEDAPATR